MNRIPRDIVGHSLVVVEVEFEMAKDLKNDERTGDSALITGLDRGCRIDADIGI